jgi:mycothiol synthase
VTSGIRPARPDDAEPILAAMLGALTRGEYPGLDRHYLDGSVARLAADPELGAVAEDDGRLAGWIVPGRFDLTVDLPYRRRGHATRLLAAGRDIARRGGVPDLRLWVPQREASEAFARASGMRYHSSLWQLRLPAGTPLDPPRFATDRRVRPILPAEDDVAFVELVNDTFRDHPTPLVLDLEQMRRVHARPGFDPSTILLVTPAVEPGRLVAFCRIRGHADDEGRPTWEVAQVGVREALRGRGLGRELVRWGVTEARRRGAGDVLLSVESENEGALRLYESLGFGRDLEWRRWAEPSR